MIDIVDSYLGKELCQHKKKEYKQKHLIVCNLHELYVAFKKKNSNVKIPPNFVLFFRSGVPLLDQRIHFHCVYVVFTIIVVLLDDAINRGISYKDPTKKVV